MVEMKVTPYEVEGKVDYDRIIKQFGVSKLTPLLNKKIGTDNLLVKREAFYAHRDLDKLLGKKFAIVSGRGPTERMHLGHLASFKAVRDIQKEHDCFVFIPFSDDEKMLVKDLDFEEVRKLSYDNALDIIALGFDPKKTEIMFDLSHMKQDIYNLAIKASSRITLSTVKAVMGFSESKNIGSFFYPAMQISHILYPSLKHNVPVLVIISVDQDPFVRLSRDVAEKLGLPKPGDLITKYLPGLTGESKMSASDPKSALYTTDSPKEIEKKLRQAFSGGQETLEEHRRSGGNPDIDACFQYLKFFFEEDDKKLAQIYNNYRSGKMLTSELKDYTIKKALKFFSEHQKNREKAKAQLKKFIKD